MRKRLIWGSVVLVGLVLLATAASTAASSFSTWYGRYTLSSSSTWYGRYTLGATISFKVEGQQRCSWGCCCSCCQPSCTETQVTGWRVADASGSVIYSVVHDAPVLASTWQGSWTQIDSGGASVSAGSYTLYVDTSVGTLSRCLYLYEPCCGSCCSSSCCGSSRCGCGWGLCSWGWSRCGWSRCGCGQQSTITSCGCRTSLVLVKESTSCCYSRSLWPCCP